ncbi:hypothetical protein [Actinomadura harenae]|uniref:HK97 gp10 family phage protein n=1 Tax=Actinomadura harenae TaxID=2483351 RepID=A0A3M2LS18_9ACTN|nr:hypothetical protein [Actinomadura harenae]RMI39876.1 hypothetical protein EBO15_28325 [Actinomadura harenae]
MPSDQLLRIENGQRLRELARTFRQLEDGKVLRKALRAELKRTAVQLQRAEQKAVTALPSKAQNARLARMALRRRVSRATQIRIRMAGPRTGVMVWVNPRRMPAGQGNLPAYLEGLRPFSRWRHPVFGRATDRWVTQRPHPWFYRTAYRYEGQAQRAAAQAINRLADEIESRT